MGNQSQTKERKTIPLPEVGGGDESESPQGDADSPAPPAKGSVARNIKVLQRKQIRDVNTTPPAEGGDSGEFESPHGDTDSSVLPEKCSVVWSDTDLPRQTVPAGTSQDATEPKNGANIPQGNTSREVRRQIQMKAMVSMLRR